MTRRLALALGAALFLGAVAATFLPTSPDGATCGTWVSPEWSQAKVTKILEEAGATNEQAEAFETSNPGAGGQAISDQVQGIALAAARSYTACNDSLDNRRTLSLVLLGLALAVPVGVIYVAGRKS